MSLRRIRLRATEVPPLKARIVRGPVGPVGPEGPQGPQGDPGDVTAAGVPEAGELARFTGATTIEGRTPAETRADLDLEIGVDVQAFDADLSALAGISADGLLARTGGGTAAARTLTGPAAGISIADGGGVAGNPTLALANDLAALEGLSSTGVAVRTATDTWAQRSIAAGTAIGVTNGDGVSGNPTVAVTDAELLALAGLASGANKLPYFTGSGTAALADFSAAGRAIVDDADAAAQRSTLELVGQQTIWVPAAAMTPRTTNGAAAGSLETSTNDVMAKYLAFDSTTSEAAQVAIQMPKSWNEGSIVAQFIWTHPSTTTNFGVRWGLRAVAFADDDGLDAAFGTEQEVTDTGGTTTDVYITGETGAMTVAGSPAAEELVVFEVYRDPADGGDTMAVDAYLLGVKIHYTTDAARDD